MHKDILYKSLLVLLVVTHVQASSISSFVYLTKQIFMSGKALIVGSAVIGLIVGLQSWKIVSRYRRKIIENNVLIDSPIIRKKNENEEINHELEKIAIEASLSKMRMHSSSSGELSDLSRSSRSMLADEFTLKLSLVTPVEVESSGELSDRTPSPRPMLGDSDDEESQNVQQNKFEPEGDLLFTSEDIEQAIHGRYSEDQRLANLPINAIWPDPDLFKGIHEVPLLYESLIDIHLEELMQKLRIEDADYESFKTDAKFLIKFGGRCFFQLLEGNENSLPSINVDFHEEDVVAMLQQKAQLQVINAIMWFLYSQALFYEEQFWEGTFVLSSKKVGEDNAIVSLKQLAIESILDQRTSEMLQPNNTNNILQDLGKKSKVLLDEINSQSQVLRVFDYCLKYVKSVNTDWNKQTGYTGSGNNYAYGRISTHWKELQQKYMQFGIDIDTHTTNQQIFIDPQSIKYSLVYILANGEIHTLFGLLGNKELFFKPESSGCCRTKLCGYASHSLGAVGSALRKTLGGNDQIGMRKEHLPYELVTKAQELQIQGIINAGYPIKSFNQLWKALNKADQTKDVLKKLKEKMAGWRHAALRYGNEVYSTLDDLLPAARYYNEVPAKKQQTNFIH